MHKFVTVKATTNGPNIMYAVEKMETVPDEEVEKKEQLMDHIFGEALWDLNNNGKKASKVIVFCFLRNDCAMIYDFFLQRWDHKEINCHTVLFFGEWTWGINCPDVLFIFAPHALC